MKTNQTIYKILDKHHLIVTEKLAQAGIKDITQAMLDIPELQDEIQKPNSEDYSDWNVCETCEVILIDESEPANACNCTVRNALRAEIRTAIKLIGGK